MGKNSVGRRRRYQGRDTCASCSTGKYTPSTNYYRCYYCSSGKVSKGDKSGCDNCAAGKYQHGISCKQCGNGQYQNSVGQTGCKGCTGSTQYATNGASGFQHVGLVRFLTTTG